MFGKVRRERTEYYQKRYLDCNAKKKMIKVTGIKRGKKETGIENNLLARKMIIRKNYKFDVSICDFYPLGRSIKKSNAFFR